MSENETNKTVSEASESVEHVSVKLNDTGAMFHDVSSNAFILGDKVHKIPKTPRLMAAVNGGLLSIIEEVVEVKKKQALFSGKPKDPNETEPNEEGEKQPEKGKGKGKKSTPKIDL